MHVVICNVLSGSGYRLRATSKTGEVNGHSNLLRGFGAALAQPCRARTRDGRRRCSGERGHRGVEPSCLRLRRTTQHMRKPQEAISGTLAALRSIASSLIEFAKVFRAIGITASTQGAKAPAITRPRREHAWTRARDCQGSREN